MTVPELTVGAQLPVQRVEVRADAMKVFSLLTADPNPIHWDSAAVRAQGLGDRPINQGGLNAGYVANAVAAWAGSRTALRELRVRFRGSVAAGDPVDAGGEVVQTATDGCRVHAVLRVWLRDAAGTDVVVGTASVELPAPENPGSAS